MVVGAVSCLLSWLLLPNSKYPSTALTPLQSHYGACDASVKRWRRGKRLTGTLCLQPRVNFILQHTLEADSMEGRSAFAGY